MKAKSRTFGVVFTIAAAVSGSAGDSVAQIARFIPTVHAGSQTIQPTSPGKFELTAGQTVQIVCDYTLTMTVHQEQHLAGPVSLFPWVALAVLNGSTVGTLAGPTKPQWSSQADPAFTKWGYYDQVLLTTTGTFSTTAVVAKGANDVWCDTSGAVAGASESVAFTGIGFVRSTGVQPVAQATPAVFPGLPPGSMHHAPPIWNGSRVDLCLQWGAQCGLPAATEFCKREGYTKAIGWQPEYDMGAQSPTLVLGPNKLCSDASCDGFASITCSL